MKRRALIQFFAVGLSIVLVTAATAGSLDYPKTRQVDQVDDFFGTQVQDPYRWLEQVDDPDVQAWVAKENAITRSYLDPLPARGYIVERLTELLNYPRHGVPFRRGDWVFFSKNDGLQDQSVYYKQKGLKGDPTVLIDPNGLSGDGTVSLGAMSFTNDGSMVAYMLHQSGSDWGKIHIRNVADGTEHTDVIDHCRFTGISWLTDNSGFYYSRYAEGEEHYQKLYLHRVGDSQAQDSLIYERPDNQDLGVAGEVTHDGQYLIVHVWNGTASENEIYVQHLTQQGAPIEPLFMGFDYAYNFVGAVNNRLYFITDKNAPRKRVIAVEYSNAAHGAAKEIIPQGDDVLESVVLTNGRIAASYMHNAYDALRMYSYDGEFLQDIVMPTIGSLGGIRGSQDDTDLFVSFTSFLFPSQNYRYDFDAGQLKLYQKAAIDFDVDAYTVRQVFYESKDGTKIPMFLVHRRGISLDGDNPTLIYGYGGFNISITPRFSTSRLFWLEQGGILAMPTLRGGGEFGEDWHRAGMLGNKQNVFDDFIGAAEYMVANGYTNSERIAIEGGSNGGLLTAACAVQRPDLYGVVLSRVPVIDMLRYQLFTIGSYWIPEYGDPTNEEHFDFLYAYSPLHNVKAGTQYPAMFITTADTDTRVDPAHAKKFAATVQAANASDNPILLRVDTKAGHGAGKPISKRIEETADIYSFVLDRMGLSITHHGAIVEETAR